MPQLNILGYIETCRSDQRRRLVNGQLATRRTASAATASVEKEIKEEELELATLRELGLPSSFGVSRTVNMYWINELIRVNSYSICRKYLASS